MVSVIIPTFNRAVLISETIKSIQAQTYTNWELIIVDDHSSDNTKEVVDRFVFNDKRIKYFTRPSDLPKGANSCRNYGLNISKGEFIKWMDSDDILISDCLKKQVNILNQFKSINLCLGYSQFFNHTTNMLQEYWSRNFESTDLFFDHLVNEIRWHVGGLLWRKSWLNQNPFNPYLKNSQEWLMHSESLFKLNSKEIYNLKEIFCLVRRGHERMSSSRSSQYFYHQAKARVLFLNCLMMGKKASFKIYFQLIKQILVYLFYSILNFLKGSK